MQWRPNSERKSVGGRVNDFQSKDGTWAPLVGKCRIERLYKATMFDQARVVVVVSHSVEIADGIISETTEEWASGLGLVRVVDSSKDPSGRDLEVSERRLVRVLRAGK